jgi:hypothetical protein
MDLKSRRNHELPSLGQRDLPGMGAQGDVDLMGTAGILGKHRQQSLGVKGAARPGDRNDQLHGKRLALELAHVMVELLVLV